MPFHTQYNLRYKVAPAGSLQLRAQDPVPIRRFVIEGGTGPQGREGGNGDGGGYGNEKEEGGVGNVNGNGDEN